MRIFLKKTILSGYSRIEALRNGFKKRKVPYKAISHRHTEPLFSVILGLTENLGKPAKYLVMQSITSFFRKRLDSSFRWHFTQNEVPQFHQYFLRRKIKKIGKDYFFANFMPS